MSIQLRIEKFIKREGRRPRILVSNMGQESHDRETKLLAAFFAEAGFDVDLSPLKQTPRRTARMALENDVHLICFFSRGNAHQKLIASLVRELKALEAETVRIIMGGTIPQTDHRSLYDAGASLILNSLPAGGAEINLILDLFENRT